ncbi:MAG: HD-GYP domain-containing protein [Eubacteriales bacterium]
MSIANFSNNKIDKKRVLIAVALGIFSYFISTLPIHIQFTSNYEITILGGLVLPLFIAVLWGWRYGLISACFGGVQALWFSGLNQGYGLLYTVFMYMAWIVWHGIFSNLRAKKTDEHKWYQSIYSVELGYRLIFEAGYFFAFPYLVSLGSPAWQLGAGLGSVSRESLFFTLSFRVLIGYVLMFLFRVVLLIFTGKHDSTRVTQNSHSKNIVHISLFFSLIIIFLQAVGATYFSATHYGSIMENLMNFESGQIFTRSLLIASFMAFGFALQHYFNKSETTARNLQETHTALKRHEEDINHVLQLASDIGKAEKVDPANFLSNLLQAAVNIIPEAEHGFAFRYQHGHKVIISEVGHNDLIVGAKINLFTMSPKNEVVIADNIKAHLLAHIGGSDYFKIRENMKSANESMLLLCEHDKEIVAGMVLGIDASKSVRFSKQSLKIAGFLKDISVAFYNYLHLAEEREDTYKDIILSSLNILSLHNPYTKDHSTGVANLSREIALCMDFDHKEVETIYWAGLVHDIGKILISDEILDKGGKLTDEEFEIIKRHAVFGYETFKESPNLTDISKYIFHHHERWDGNGYPYGLSECNIPLPSRILSVADVFDALTHDRPYRKAISASEALDYIKENAGMQFDPDICDTFISNFDVIFENYNAS